MLQKMSVIIDTNVPIFGLFLRRSQSKNFEGLARRLIEAGRLAGDPGAIL
jgi:hypothetical protein